MFGKKYSFLVSRICHSPGMPVCDGEDIPEVDFDFCDPNVRASEITNLYLALPQSDPFADWSDPGEWYDRLSQTSNDRNAIRTITCMGDKAVPVSVRKDISNDRKKITRKTHTLLITIDDVSALNHEFVQSLKTGRILRTWYDISGGYTFGGNGGIMAKVYGDMVLVRGQGEIMTYELQIIWDSLRTEDRIETPVLSAMSLTFDIALCPAMRAQEIVLPDPPATTGYFAYELAADTGALWKFINIHPLINAYPVPLTVNFQGETNSYMVGDPSNSIAEFTVMPETAKNIVYHIPYNAGSVGSNLVWTKAPDSTIEFEDTIGNKAIISPLIRLDVSANTILDYSHPALIFELAYSTADIATVRVTRMILGEVGSPVTGTDMDWIFPSAYREDPAHVGNENIKLIDLAAGYHTIGATVSYHTASIDLPQSKVTVVIWIH